MDSFFSLFDPADSVATPRVKERRRGRKSETTEPGVDNGGHAERVDDKSPKKSAHVPEESSFLCEPQFSKDVLADDISYLDSYMVYEPHRQVSESKSPEDKKEEKKKRSCGRKSRRKKKSPPKDFVPKQCWNADNLFYPECYQDYSSSRRCSEEKEQVSWNNKSSSRRHKTPVGRNVNDLQTERSEYGSKCKRRTEPFDLAQADGDLTVGWPVVEESPTHTVMDTIEKATIQDDMYLAGEWSSDALESDLLYMSDEEDTVDSSSDRDSGDETYGSLPPEPQLGNVEYKLQLVNPSEKRFQHLVTQLKWRLRSGGGSAVYVLGVRDCGALRGLRARPLRASLRTLRNMAAALHAELRHVTARRLAVHRAVAQVYIRKLADTQQSVEMRVAVMGANEAGKSTLIGVLTQGELDNGRGSARLNMFRHLHEVRSGRTSSLSHEILGFDAQGNVVNYGCSELMTAERIGERSAKLVSFLDLAGHSKYQRTTVHGLTGYCPHLAMLVVSATAGISRMTEEHLALLSALDLPFFVVVTRIDLAPARLAAFMCQFHDILKKSGSTLRPRLISNEQKARACAAPVQTPLLDQMDTEGDLEHTVETEASVPVFPVSCVTGRGLSALHGYLLALEPPRQQRELHRPHPEEEACEFQIDEIFRVGETSGPVVGGLLASGVLHEGDSMLVGPMDTGDFVPMTVKTVYRNRVPCGAVRAGQSASLGLSHRPPALRQGMALVAVPATREKRTNLDIENQRTKEADFEDIMNTIDDNIDNIKKDENNINNNDMQFSDDEKITHNADDENNIKNDMQFGDDEKITHNANDENNINNNVMQFNDDEKITHNAGDENNTKSENLTDADVMKAELDSRRTKAVKDLKKWDVKHFKRKDRNVLQEIKNVENSLNKETKLLEGNIYKSDSESSGNEKEEKEFGMDELLLEDPNNPRGCLYFQATVRVLRHSTTEIYAGFQATVHIGSIRQTAVIQGIMTRNGELVAGQSASVVFRFVRQPEYVRAGRKMLFRAGLETCGVGRVTQVFPMESTH